jgi:hypothetical protein
MKKIIFAFAVLATSFASAQVGVGNTSPKATLDVTGVSTTTVADGVLVPRYTAATLATKDAAYGADQNGALVFITDITGATGKTSNVTAVGFYYYDHATSKWKAVGASAAPSLPTFRTVAGAATTNILTSDFDNVVIITGTVTGDIQLPSPTGYAGRKITIIHTGGSGATQCLTCLNSNYLTNTLGSLGQYGTELITDGTNWYGLGGQ